MDIFYSFLKRKEKPEGKKSSAVLLQVDYDVAEVIEAMGKLSLTRQRAKFCEEDMNERENEESAGLEGLGEIDISQHCE